MPSKRKLFFLPSENLSSVNKALFYSTPITLLSPVPNIFKHATSCFTYMTSNMLLSLCSCFFLSNKWRNYFKPFNYHNNHTFSSFLSLTNSKYKPYVCFLCYFETPSFRNSSCFTLTTICKHSVHWPLIFFWFKKN